MGIFDHFFKKDNKGDNRPQAAIEKSPQVAGVQDEKNSQPAAEPKLSDKDIVDMYFGTADHEYVYAIRSRAILPLLNIVKTYYYGSYYDDRKKMAKSYLETLLLRMTLHRRSKTNDVRGNEEECRAATRILLGELNDSEIEVRRIVVLLMGMLQDPAVLPILQTVYERDDNPDVKEAVKKSVSVIENGCKDWEEYGNLIYYTPAENAIEAAKKAKIIEDRKRIVNIFKLSRTQEEISRMIDKNYDLADTLIKVFPLHEIRLSESGTGDNSFEKWLILGKVLLENSRRKTSDGGGGDNAPQKRQYDDRYLEEYLTDTTSFILKSKKISTEYHDSIINFAILLYNAGIMKNAFFFIASIYPSTDGKINCSAAEYLYKISYRTQDDEFIQKTILKLKDFPYGTVTPDSPCVNYVGKILKHLEDLTKVQGQLQEMVAGNISCSVCKKPLVYVGNLLKDIQGDITLNYHTHIVRIPPYSDIDAIFADPAKALDFKPEYKKVVNGVRLSIARQELYNGIVCYSCHKVFCPDCNKKTGLFVCPECGEPIHPATLDNIPYTLTKDCSLSPGELFFILVEKMTGLNKQPEIPLSDEKYDTTKRRLSRWTTE